MKIMPPRLICWLVLLASVTMCIQVSARAENWTITKDGSSHYVILVADDASPTVLNAAGELQNTLERMTDIKLPIVKASDAQGTMQARYLFVGDSPLATATFPETEATTYKMDEICIRTDAVGNVLLTGHPRRGALYAVVTFEEDTLGCRWWTSKDETIPYRPTLEIPELNVRYAPPLIYRESYYQDALTMPFAVRCRCNGSAAPIPDEWGGHNKFVYFVHSFGQLIPYTYYTTHPEWFPEIDGVRKVGVPDWIGSGKAFREFETQNGLKPEQVHREGTQLCLANDEMRAELTQNALKLLRNNPGGNIISISQNDWRGYCTCEKCRALDEANGSQAGSLINFVNQVAADIEKEFPDVLVETLAYQYTRTPPTNIKPRHNVIVRLCSIECSFLTPLEQGGINQKFADDIRGWSEIAPQLFVWNYVTNFSNYLLPHPNMRTLGANIRFFTKHKVVGLFEQGDTFTTCGDFVAARNWVESHLLWNPELDEKALWEEFCTNYYGPEAGNFLLEYLNLLHDTAQKSNFNLRCFLPDTRGWLDSETILKLSEIATRARVAVKDDPILSRRVNRALVSHDFNWLQRWHELNCYCRAKQKTLPIQKNPREMAEHFIDFLEAEGTRYHHEAYWGYSWDEFKMQLIEQFPTVSPKNPDLTCLGIENPDWDTVVWLDFQDLILRLAGKEKGWGERVDDPVASDGRAIRMPGWHYEWATAYTFPEGICNAGQRWHIYATVRWDATAKEGVAMTCGIYDWELKKGVVNRTLTVDGINSSVLGDADGYRLVDFGVHELNNGAYIWFAPPKRPDDVQNVYIDRIFMIKEGTVHP